MQYKDYEEAFCNLKKSLVSIKIQNFSSLINKYKWKMNLLLIQLLFRRFYEFRIKLLVIQYEIGYFFFENCIITWFQVIHLFFVRATSVTNKRKWTAQSLAKCCQDVIYTWYTIIAVRSYVLNPFYAHAINPNIWAFYGKETCTCEKFHRFSFHLAGNLFKRRWINTQSRRLASFSK